MRNYFIIIILIIFNFNSIGQNAFFIGKKSYNCTDQFHLISNKGFDGIDLDALIVKNELSAFLVLSVKSDHLRIKGTVLVYLEDGTVINCVDRNKFDVLDGIATTIYNLTPQVVQYLKQSNMQTIRFSLKIANGYWASDEGDFSVRNEYIDWNSNKRFTNDIPNLVNNLFNEKVE